MIHIHSNEGEEYATKEFIQIREQIALETHQLNALGNYGLIKAFFSRRYRRRLMWVIFIQLATSLTGASVAATYQSIMFGNVGLSGHTLLLVSACYGFMGPSFSLMNILFIADRWGRRMTCFMGAFTLGIDLSLIMALCGAFATNAGDTRSESIASIAFIFLFSGLFSISFENTPAVVCTEILPFFIRGLGFGISQVVASCVGILISELTPIIFAKITWKFYGVFVATNFLASIVYLSFMPETKGYSLEEMATLFGEEVAETG